MRNLKRVLCLALASVMLLGMMVIGASATSFTDDADIVYTEAVEITAGLGLFAGSDGKFMPKGNVTRAQMATIIVKMLYGSEINADQYKGVGTFSDTAAFEGGWAEGYINLCANLGVVAGYPDGTFKPGNQVTTAEAVTMIINALGVDAGTGSWPLTVMSKAEEMELFKDLAPKPGTNVALTRDELASIALQGLEYSPAGATGYKVPGVKYTFTNYADALQAGASLTPKVTAAQIEEVIGEDALASKTFGMVKATGMVTSNQATVSGQEFTTIGGVDYNIETGLDKIGHIVTVYFKDEYKSEKEPGTTYAIVDECDVYTVETAITGGTPAPTADEKDFKAIFGNKDLYDPAVAVATFAADYTTTAPAYAGTEYVFATKHAAAGTYVVSDGAIVSFRLPDAPRATYVTGINATSGKETITLNGIGKLNNNEDEDKVNEYAGIAKDDVVVAVLAGDTYTVTKAETVEGKATRIYVDTKTGKTMITVSGTTYSMFTGTNSLGGKYTTAAAVATFDMDPTYRFFVNGSEILAYEKIDGQADLSNIVYVIDLFKVAEADAYGKDIVKVSAQYVDMDGKVGTYLMASYEETTGTPKYQPTETVGTKDSSLPAGTFGMTFNTSSGALGGTFAGGFYTFEKVDNSKLAALGLMTATKVGAYVSATATPIYAHQTSLAAAMDKKTTNIKLAAGDKAVAYLKGDSKFISYDGTGAALAATVTTGSMIYDPTAAGNTAKLDVLLSRDNNGNAVLEAAMVAQDPDKVKTGDFVYITSWDHKSADGEVYKAYTSDGTATTITVENTITTPLYGFYSYTVKENGVYEVDPLSNIYTFANQTFQSVYNDLLVATPGVNNFDIKNAKLVDARSETAIENTNILDYEITSIDELIAQMNDENYTTTIVVDLYAEDEVVSVIYIEAITVV